MPRAAKASRAARPAARLLAEPPLQALTRDQLSVFLYVALVPGETRAIVKELGLSMPGFRPEGLGDVQRCDLVADEIRADPAAAAPVLRALRAAFGEPPLGKCPQFRSLRQKALVVRNFRQSEFDAAGLDAGLLLQVLEVAVV